MRGVSVSIFQPRVVSGMAHEGDIVSFRMSAGSGADATLFLSPQAMGELRDTLTAVLDSLPTLKKGDHFWGPLTAPIKPNGDDR